METGVKDAGDGAGPTEHAGRCSSKMGGDAPDCPSSRIVDPGGQMEVPRRDRRDRRDRASEVS
jgi:hypothetical protein